MNIDPATARFQKCFSRRLKSDLIQHWPAYLMILPAIALTFLFSYVPMYGILLAFKKYSAAKGILGSPWIGFAHFHKFLGSPHFAMLLRNTLHIGIYGMLVSFPLQITLALLINEVRNIHFKKAVQTISYMPYFISMVVLCGMLKSFLGYDGTLNAFRMLISGAKPIHFLSEPRFFPSIVVWSDQWTNAGWGTIIYLSALSSIDQQLYEAARIDGCGRFRQILHVTLPGLLPTIVMLMILNINVLTVNSEKILLLYSPLTYETGDVFGTFVYRQGIKGGKYDYSTAVGLFVMVVSLITTLFVNWVSKKTTDQSLW